MRVRPVSARQVDDENEFYALSYAGDPNETERGGRIVRVDISRAPSLRWASIFRSRTSPRLSELTCLSEATVLHVLFVLLNNLLFLGEL